MEKEDVVIYTKKYYSAIKKEILPFVTIRIDIETIMLSEIRERQISYDFINILNLNNKINEEKNKLINKDNKFMVTR